MSSVCGDDISRLKLDEERHRVWRDYHDEQRKCAVKARERMELLEIGFVVATASLGDGGTAVVIGPEVGSEPEGEKGNAAAEAVVIVEGSVDAGDDESDWGVVIYATALVEGCKNFEEALDALFDAYGSPLKIDGVAKTLLKAKISKAGKGNLADRLKNLKSTIYSLAAQKPHLRCAAGLIERSDGGSAVGSDVARQAA